MLPQNSWFVEIVTLTSSFEKGLQKNTELNDFAEEVMLKAE